MKGNCDNCIEKIETNENLKIIEVDNITFYLNHGHQYSYEKRNTFKDKIKILFFFCKSSHKLSRKR